MLALSLRRAARPVKLQLAVLLVASVFLYGGAKTGNLWGESFDSGGAFDTVSAERRLAGAEEPAVEGDGGGDSSANVLPSNAWAAVNAFGLLYCFLGLAIVCDEFFVPALDVITEKLGLSPDVAGATFMAAGGSAPEFFTAMVGALSKPPSDVGIATIVGSAVFNVLFVIGACGLAAPGRLELTWYPLARDSAFYVVHLLLLCCWFYDGRIDWWESLIQFVMYVLYCVFMAYSERVENYMNDRTEFKKLDRDGDGLISREDCAANGDTELVEQFDKLDGDKDGSLDMAELKMTLRHRRALRQQSTMIISQQEVPPDEAVSLRPPTGGGCKEWLYYLLSLPIVLVLMITVPDVRRMPECWKSFYALTFFLSIIWVALFSFVMVECSVVIGKWTQIDQRILALTLIAAGTSVPDLLTSVIVTMQGHGDMAISSSIGSNIFDVTVGMPVPWLVYHTWYKGAHVSVNSKPMTMFVQIGSLIMMLMAVVVSIKCTGWVLSKPLGGCMLVLYIAFMVVSVYQVMQEEP